MDMNAEEFDWVARNIFAPVYPVIAGQIKEKTGISEGFCIDLGCGGGYLGIALAGITDMNILLLDESPEMISIARHNLAASGLERRVWAVTADVHSIPLADDTADLVVSRGSVFFWKDKGAAFREIRRVLKPGGRAYIGGGMGSSELMQEIGGEMKAMNRDLGMNGKSSEKMYQEVLRSAGFVDFTVRRGDAGFWIEAAKMNTFTEPSKKLTLQDGTWVR
jgi:ubiquinone/menaquinone biosynthesis C-methylase UbiE